MSERGQNARSGEAPEIAARSLYAAYVADDPDPVRWADLGDEAHEHWHAYGRDLLCELDRAVKR